ncbi:hypothetical protein HOD96_00995 [Candidatus Falkowbacteria bacterium]|jgi:hypothetical protein|nr:hypothetical protein [Candidatus Falkowbacteria bacterium]MBT4433388.1 hypothetical protein [Candidatus Falkowbacteria bacterium]
MSEQTQQQGEKIKSWTFPEYIKHNRTTAWYVGAFLMIGLLLLYSARTDNFLFAIVMIMIFVVVIHSHKQDPLKMKFSIYENGILLNEKFYGFKGLNNFWIAYDPPEVKKLYFEVDNIFKSILIIPIEKNSPLELRDILTKYLEEDLEKEGESTSEALGRMMKL